MYYVSYQFVVKLGVPISKFTLWTDIILSIGKLNLSEQNNFYILLKVGNFIGGSEMIMILFCFKMILMELVNGMR